MVANSTMLVQNLTAQHLDDIMVNHLLVNGVTDKFIIENVLNYPRSLFLQNDLKSMGNSDGCVYYQKNKFLIEISTLAYMIMASKMPHEKNVLVIGSGVGYASTILANIYNSVIGIEEEQGLTEKATLMANKVKLKNLTFVKSNLLLEPMPKALATQSLMPVINEGVLAQDLPLLDSNQGLFLAQEYELKNIFKDNSFDLIFVEGAYSYIPPRWLEVLTAEGNIIGVQRKDNLSQIVKSQKLGNGLVHTYYKNVATPLLKGLELKKEFIF
ncbi:Protein-L-isoaspartate O-methyltransferase [Candidatus Hepatincolaceae symbiont of Richtersius coronifer]